MRNTVIHHSLADGLQVPKRQLCSHPQTTLTSFIVPLAKWYGICLVAHWATLGQHPDFAPSQLSVLRISCRNSIFLYIAYALDDTVICIYLICISENSKIVDEVIWRRLKS